MKVFLVILMAGMRLVAGELSAQQLFNVKTTVAQEAPIRDERVYYGTVGPDEGRVHEVALRFSGFIGSVAVDKPYTIVRKGEKLFDIYSPELFLAASELVNTLNSAHKGLRESIVKKLRLLGVDDRVIERIIKTKRIDEYLPVFAPADGVVTQKSVVNGSSVKAGERLYTITDLRRVWILAKVYESDLGFIQEGMEAVVSVDGRKETLRAYVERIHTEVAQGDRSVTVRVAVDNPDIRLFPGAFATVTLRTPERRGLILPKGAVITKGEKHYVFVTGEYEGEYEPTPIGAKRLPGGMFEVSYGLKAGDRVVSDALFLFDSDAQLNGLY